MAISNLFIIGAGFSANTGVPLASGFTRALLDVAGLRLDGPSNQQVRHLRSFVRDVFGQKMKLAPDGWPDLEDIFTLVDLSANTGHHLGPKYSAADLRTMRRTMIVLLVRMLERKSKIGVGKRQPKAFLEFFSRLDIAESAVLSLNWDCVLERNLRGDESIGFDYGNGARPGRFSAGEVLRDDRPGPLYPLIKPHGSINWLYCDACREIWWFWPKDIEKIAQTLFRESDWQRLKLPSADQRKVKTLSPTCPVCGSDALGTRLATFSYRKALDFPMHNASWRTGESLLREAENWIFFGYSMPAADFEFKHLLKRVELSRKTRPRIVVITGGHDAGKTLASYERFFGATSHLTSYENALDNDAWVALEALEDLK